MSQAVTYSNLCKVDILELLVFGAWCNTPVFRGMICLKDILTHRNTFQSRDAEQKVQM